MQFSKTRWVKVYYAGYATMRKVSLKVPKCLITTQKVLFD